MDEAHRRFVRELLDRYFPDLPILAEEVESVRLHAHLTPFPRSLWCDCDRCRSPLALKAVLGRTLTVKTKQDTFSTLLPGDAETFRHVWKEKRDAR